MKHRKTIAALGVALTAGGALAGQAAAHDVALQASCETALFTYSRNAAGTQRSTETVLIDGQVVYGPTLRIWSTSGGQDPQDFVVPIDVPVGAHVVTARAQFVGSDGFRYDRTTAGVSVNCSEPVPPVPPGPVLPPATPTVPPGNPIEQPITLPPGPDRPPVKRAPNCSTLRKGVANGAGAKTRRLYVRLCVRSSSTRLSKPTVCRVWSSRPANGVVGRLPRKLGQIRIRFDSNRGRWISPRGDRWQITVANGKRTVRFLPSVAGGYCYSPPVTG